MWPMSAYRCFKPCSLLECQTGLKTSHTSKQRLDLLSVYLSYARAQVCAWACLPCRYLHVWLFLHTSACMLTNVPTSVCTPLGACFSVCVENMLPSCWTSKMLAHSAVWGYMLTGCLWWTTIYNNVKLTPLIMMRRWATFQHDSPRCLLCSSLICVTRSCLWINNNATFHLRSVGCSLAAYSPPTECFSGEYSSGQMLANVWSCMCTCLLQVFDLGETE